MSDDNDIQISIPNWINLVAYVVNTLVTYGVGTVLFTKLPSIAKFSSKYQTLVTPADWAFAIWGLIFLAQLVWVVHQIAIPSHRNSPWVTSVGYDYLIVALAQAGWIFSFRFEMILLSLAMMVLILFFLGRIVMRLENTASIVSPQETHTMKAYFLWRFPFTIHFAWILVATAVNANLVLVAFKMSATVQFFMALATLVVLVICVVLLSPKDTTVPLVAAWALYAIYFELRHPSSSVKDEFRHKEIRWARIVDLVGLAIVSVAAVLGLMRGWLEARVASSEPSETSYLRADAH